MEGTYICTFLYIGKQTEKVCADLSSLRKVLGSAHLFFSKQEIPGNDTHPRV